MLPRVCCDDSSLNSFSVRFFVLLGELELIIFFLFSFYMFFTFFSFGSFGLSQSIIFAYLKSIRKVATVFTSLSMWMERRKKAHTHTQVTKAIAHFNDENYSGQIEFHVLAAASLERTTSQLCHRLLNWGFIVSKVPSLKGLGTGFSAGLWIL